MICNLFNSYTMGTSGLPDIYTQRPEGVYIRQTTSAHGITNIYQLMCGQTSTIIASWPPCIYMGTYWIALWV